MAGTQPHADALRQVYPLAVDAECTGDGWAILTYGDGRKESARCLACAGAILEQQVRAFIPPRFRQPITLPPAVGEWAARGESAQGLYLAGQVGTGKTHTAWHAAMTWCVETGTIPTARRAEAGSAGPTVIFTRMTDLLDDLRPGDDSRVRIRDCQEARLLIIDDVGAEKASEWTQERLYSIIDHRYANCRPLIVTSNLPPGEIRVGGVPRNPLADQTGARTESRLAEMCLVVPMTGTDRRKPS